MTEYTQAEPLLTCLRLDQAERKLAQLQALTVSEWVAAVDQARLHGVMPVLFWQLNNLSGQASPLTRTGLLTETRLPEACWEELHVSFLNGAGKNMLIYRDLGGLLEALQPAGIRVILLKGLHLAQWVYPEIALRLMADIDLLLRREDLAQAAHILHRLGYQSTREYELAREIRKHQHIPPLCKTGKAPVELHWHIASPGIPLDIDLDGLWARAQPVEVAGYPAWVLAPEDLLLHLSLHLLQDEFIGGLKRLYDIVALTSNYGERLDWVQVQTRAVAWGCRKSLFLVLHLARTLFNAPVRDQVLEQLRPTDFTAQIDALARQRATSVRRSPPELHPDLARLRRNRPIYAKAAALLGVLFPYPEYVAAKYSLPPGSRKVYFYYLVRLKDLARRYGWQLWRVLRSEEAAVALAKHENALSDWWMAG